MSRLLARLTLALLIVPASGAWSSDPVPEPERRVTSAAEQFPRDMASIQVTAKLMEVSLSKLQRETGLRVEVAPNERVPNDLLQKVVDAIDRSNKTSEAEKHPIDAATLLSTLERHNLARELTSAGEFGASGAANRLVAGGLDRVASYEGSTRQTRSSSRISFYAAPKGEEGIGLDLCVRFSVYEKSDEVESDWEQISPTSCCEWQIASVQPAGEATIWMGPVEERTEAVEKRTWYGRTKTEERVIRVATLLVVETHFQAARQLR